MYDTTMNATSLSLFQIGTPHGHRLAWAARSLDVSSNELRTAAEDGLHGLGDWETRVPQACGLVFIEPPTIGLAAAIAAEETDDPAAWLAMWRKGAQHVLRLSQRYPTRWWLVDAAEARQHPHAWAEACRKRFGTRLPVGRATLPADTATDPLCRALSDALCHSDRDAQALLAELEASCAVLAPEAPAVLSAGLGLRIDGAAAVRHLRGLQAARPAPVTAAPVERASPETHLEIEALRHQLRSASEESELLLKQIGQLHEELEDGAEQCRELELRVASAVSSSSLIALSIGDLRASAERNVPPYRELTLELRDVRVGSRTVPTATIRLVEHNGYPGLVIFADAQGTHLTACWQELGQEYGIPYALLIPKYPPSLPIFDAMQSADWSLLQGLLARIEKYMQAHAMLSAPRWSLLARRLRELLLEMPPRFRFASLNINSVPGAETPTLSFRFAQVMCGARELPRLTLLWRPEGPHAGMDLLCDVDTDASPPFPLWPNDAQGRAPDRVTLPLGPGERDPDQRDDWPRLTPADRAFVMALLAIWPEVVSEVPALLRQEPGMASLTEAAATALASIPSGPAT